MRNPEIQSITITVPSCLVNGSREYLSDLFKRNNWGNYFKYGYYSLILIDLKNFSPWYPSIINLITNFIYFLQINSILSPQLSYQNIGIHEINLSFYIDFPEAIFCNTNYFYKVDDITYRSNDTRQYLRRNKYSDEENCSKGRQRSFLTVKQYNEIGTTMVFDFSGKYAKHIPFYFLTLNYDELIQKLCTLGSIYLTHATCPNGLKVAKGYIPFLPESLQTILNHANWFNGNFTKKYYKPNILRGGFL
jgi:hypothetical protein